MVPEPEELLSSEKLAVMLTRTQISYWVALSLFDTTFRIQPSHDSQQAAGDRCLIFISVSGISSGQAAAQLFLNVLS